MAKQKKPEFEKTRTIRLRLGFRLNSIFWPIDVPSIAGILDKLGYKDIQTDSVNSTRATKSNSDFYLDYPKFVFGFYANTPDGLISAQREFFASVEKDFNTNLNKFVRFYEIENIMAYFITNSSDNEIIDIFSDSSDIGTFSNIIGDEVRVSKIELAPKDAKVSDDDWYNIEIASKLESASNAYHCRLVRRSKNLENIIKALRKSNEILEKTAEYIEKKNQN